MFVSQAPGVLDSIANSLANRDHKSLVHYAHKLKGFSRNLGVAKLARFCEVLEKDPQKYLNISQPEVMNIVNQCFGEAEDELLSSWHRDFKV